jgi:hypothetical protein
MLVMNNNQKGKIMSLLTNEELDYFSNAFSLGDGNLGNGTLRNESTDNRLSEHSLSVETEIPQVLTHLLGHSKLTLLAEISYYRLFFPLELKTDEFGGLTPTLGTPEVIDTRGGERSWRLDELEGVRVVDEVTQKDIEVLSLSSSGMTVKVPQGFEHKTEHSSELVLPDGTHLGMEYEEVRTENGVMAVKINAQGQPRKVLREFLFNQHKVKYSHLYKSISG